MAAGLGLRHPASRFHGGQPVARLDVQFKELIVVPASGLPRHPREARSYDRLWGLTRPADVIVLTRAEFNRASRVLPAGYLSLIEERCDEPVRPLRDYLKKSQN